MSVVLTVLRPTGILLPEAVLHTNWFSVFATFVAINTVVYVVLGVIKLLPAIRRRSRRGRDRRSETRSIRPDAPV